MSSRPQCPNRYLLQPGQRGLGPGWALQGNTQAASTPWRAGGRRPVCSLHDGCVPGGEQVCARGRAGVCPGESGCLPGGERASARGRVSVCPGGVGVFRCAVPPHGCTWHGGGLLAHVPGLTMGMAWEARRQPLPPRPGGPAPSPRPPSLLSPALLMTVFHFPLSIRRNINDIVKPRAP